MKEYLFLFTIGPVKSFINDSRKSQDLFASSSLLSELCRDAIVLADEKFEGYNFELITPYIESIEILGNKKNPSIPNRFLAKIKTDNSKEDLKELAQKIEDQLKESFSIIKNGKKEVTLSQSAQEQLENHLDIRWLYEPLSENFSESFKNINKNLAAIKNYNQLKPLNELGRKCIVDGKLNVKFYRKNKKEEFKDKGNNGLLPKLYQKKEEVEIISEDNENEFKIWQIQKGEGISAVTLKKRLHQQKPHDFPSTVHICLLHVFKELVKDENFNNFKRKVQGTKDGYTKYFSHSNDQLFYKENIELLFRKEGEEHFKKCVKDHEAWSKYTETPLTKYYALIRFDGDKLGDWFSGKFKKNDIKYKDYQIKLSEYIIDFADDIKEKISLENYNGKVIYAGGEDFMAMVDLHKLQETVHLIRKQFKTLVSDKMQNHNSNEYQKEFTLSMGICIAHYKEPLQMVLDKAKAMEKKAKDSGRNSFALAVSKHSGSQIVTHSKWSIPIKEEDIDVFKSLYTIIKYIKEKKISSAFLLKIYNYCEELDFTENVKKVVSSKKKLFIDRALEGKDNEIFEYIDNLLQVFIKNQNLKDFASLLASIDFIQRHEY